MKRKIALMLVLMMVMLCFTGCMHGENHIKINEDGSGVITARTEIEKAVYDQIAASMGMTMEDMGMEGTTVETIDGVEYYVTEETVSFGSFDELTAALEENGYTGVYASETGLRYVFDSGVTEEEVKAMEEQGFDLGDAMSAKVIITMPQEIVKTTGTLSEDKMSAEFYFEGNALYDVHDVMVSTAEETTKPTLSGYTAKKTYNSARTVVASDASGIQKVQYKYKKSADADYGKYKSMGLTKTFTKSGTYMVRAYDNYGNKITKSFTIKDTSKPKVSGVKNKGEYTSERSLQFTDNCAVSSVKLTLNGESFKLNAEQIANGVTLSDEGTYKITVKDVNGNSRTVTFTME